MCTVLGLGADKASYHHVSMWSRNTEHFSKNEEKKKITLMLTKGAAVWLEGDRNRTNCVLPKTLDWIQHIMNYLEKEKYSWGKNAELILSKSSLLIYIIIIFFKTGRMWSSFYMQNTKGLTNFDYFVCFLYIKSIFLCIYVFFYVSFNGMFSIKRNGTIEGLQEKKKPLVTFLSLLSLKNVYSVVICSL